MNTDGLIHQRIIANAGSGKTYRLTTRFIELLAREVPPERILALTFTRKAAGEFLDAIFKRLLDAATDREKAETLARAIGFPEFTQEQFRQFLRMLIEKMPQLALGTLDGFFGRIIRAFSFECGVAGQISIVDPQHQDMIRRAVLAAVFRGHSVNERAFRELLDLLRQQSRNRQSRSVVATLDAEMRLLHEKFLLTPRHRSWGEERAIWPEGLPFTGAEKLSGLVDFFARAFYAEHDAMDEKYRAGWEERFAGLRRIRDDVPPDSVSFALKLLNLKVSKKPDCFDVKLGNKIFPLPNALRPTAEAMGEAILARELRGRLERSRALYQLAARFEETYQQTVRESGHLTFLDITGLLAASGGRLWGGRSLHGSVRQQIDYRLDASYDHWLLDEFQDTSRLQWQAVQELVDEVVQSTSGQRSFFYVGDTKQAIYSWRGGDPRLFDEIAEFYNSSGETHIDVSESLDISFRSTPEILTGINTIFGPATLEKYAGEMDFPSQALERWQSAWREHKPHNPATGRGYINWQTLEGGVESLDAETARLLTDIDPVAKGWSCAVLVLSNRRITSVVNALRAAGLPAAAEGRFFPCVDNEIGAALLALLRMIAHPADTLSLAHVKMTPLAKLLEGGVEEFRFAALQAIRGRGLTVAIQAWVDQLDLEGQDFLQARTQSFLDAASDFSSLPGRGATLDEFVEFAANYSSSESGNDGAIRVMTIHAAKGLDFDIVVLPEIEGVSLPSRRDDSSIHLHTGERGEVQWGLEMPPKPVCEIDETLSRAYEEDVAEDCYEKLCLYYVALTRARRGLYLLSSRQKEESKSHDFNRLLHLTLPFGEGDWSLGNSAWFAPDGEKR